MARFLLRLESVVRIDVHRLRLQRDVLQQMTKIILKLLLFRKLENENFSSNIYWDILIDCKNVKD